MQLIDALGRWSVAGHKLVKLCGLDEAVAPLVSEMLGLGKGVISFDGCVQSRLGFEWVLVVGHVGNSLLEEGIARLVYPVVVLRATFKQRRVLAGQG